MGAFLSIFQPGFTWPRPITSPISVITPETPRCPGRLERRFYGLCHRGLAQFSTWYTRWYRIDIDGPIRRLPFGLILKWSNRTSLEEYAAMRMARAAGMPVPWVLSCGEHSGDKYDRFYSILMTALPGLEPYDSDDDFEPKTEAPWAEELRSCVHAMRQWHSPYGDSVCSVYQTAIRSMRVQRHIMGPFTTQTEFLDHLIAPSSPLLFKSYEEFIQAKRFADGIRQFSHRIVFTHGDFFFHNILVDDAGHLSGILDWETAGWLPEYFEFTTVMRRLPEESWWCQVVRWMSEDKYEEQTKRDRTLHLLTGDSYIGM